MFFLHAYDGPCGRDGEVNERRSETELSKAAVEIKVEASGLLVCWLLETAGFVVETICWKCCRKGCWFRCGQLAFSSS